MVYNTMMSHQPISGDGFITNFGEQYSLGFVDEDGDGYINNAPDHDGVLMTISGIDDLRWQKLTATV
jgi:hypothetical protein